MVQLILEGMGVGVGLAAPIGPINIEIVRRGLRGGFRAGWLVGLGAVSADTIYCALIVSGVAPIADSVRLRVPLFLAGAVVLLFLGVGSLRAAASDTDPNANTRGTPPSSRRSYVAGFLLAVANPMGIVYWLSIGGALVASAVDRAGPTGAPLLIGGVFVGIVCWVSFLAGLTRAGRRFVSAGVLRWSTAASGVLLVAFGLYFAVQGVQGLREW
jgi:threonine/homoserine/homoserine lactone efflux protein